jgi:Fic-DOC domain mobile mystery protein B
MRDQLIPTYISTLGELYEAEAENIVSGTLGRSPSPDELLDDLYLRELHRAMFREVWRWAGRYRTHDVNIGGSAWPDVSALVRNLVEDARVWTSSNTFPPDEIAVRFHHRLVQIHPFVNGNGRHGRFAAEFLVEGLGQPRFTWGAGLGVDRVELRTRYRRALETMDGNRNAVGDLLAFARA